MANRRDKICFRNAFGGKEDGLIFEMPCQSFENWAKKQTFFIFKENNGAKEAFETCAFYDVFSQKGELIGFVNLFERGDYSDEEVLDTLKKQN